jgi:hypothetical protein
MPEVQAVMKIMMMNIVIVIVIIVVVVGRAKNICPSRPFCEKELPLWIEVVRMKLR